MRERSLAPAPEAVDNLGRRATDPAGGWRRTRGRSQAPMARDPSPRHPLSDQHSRRETGQLMELPGRRVLVALEPRMSDKSVRARPHPDHHVPGSPLRGEEALADQRLLKTGVTAEAKAGLNAPPPTGRQTWDRRKRESEHTPGAKPLPRGTERAIGPPEGSQCGEPRSAGHSVTNPCDTRAPTNSAASAIARRSSIP